MASWTAERGVFVVALALATACGGKAADSGSAASSSDTGVSGDTCETQPWSWQNTGEPFMRTWCTQCHHRDLPAEQRQGAPADVNLETYDDFQAWSERIEARVWTDAAPMPPAGGPTEEELEILAEWMDCGAPE